MRAVQRTKLFEKSFAKVRASGRLKPAVVKDLFLIIDTLAGNKTLDSKYKDHALHGEYAGYRECHVRNDLLLIYKIDSGKLYLVLVDIGSHAHLFG